MPARTRGQCQAAVQLFDPLGHVAQAHAGAGRIVATGQAASVILDPHGCAASVPQKADPYAGRPGMAFDIGQRFLSDPVQRCLGLDIQPVAKNGSVKFDLQTCTSFECFAKRFQRWTESQIVQHTGAQIVADAAHLGQPEAG